MNKLIERILQIIQIPHPMKTIYKILLLTIILQTSAFSQFEVLSIIKPTTSEEPCNGKINLEFVESELPYDQHTRSEFENHAIVKYNGKYFDPSYGVDSKNTLTANDWENQALDGFGSILKYNDGTKLYYINWIGYLNDNSPQADFNP